MKANNQPDPEEMTQLQEKDAAVLRAITRKPDASEVRQPEHRMETFIGRLDPEKSAWVESGACNPQRIVTLGSWLDDPHPTPSSTVLPTASRAFREYIALFGCTSHEECCGALQL